MMKSMLSSVKNSAIKIKGIAQKAKNTTRRWVVKHRWKILIVSLIICALAITTGLILGSFKGIDVTSQAVIINYTQQKIFDGFHTNQVGLIGLNSIYYQIPRRKFIIYFQDIPTYSNEYWSPKLTARSQEGTKFYVSARVSCQISNNINHKNFLQNYGLNWRIYVIQKSKNAIIQNIGKLKFYQINNSLLLSLINSQFAKYKNTITGYPFDFLIINLKIEYPTDSFSLSANNTMGVQVLQLKSQYAQLLQNYEALNAKINGTYSSTSNNTNYNDLANSITNISARIGTDMANMNIMNMQIKVLDQNWFDGMEVLKRMFGNDRDALRRYLWLYFQKVYNGTYNNFTYF